jgi:hypothetical protein
MDLLTPEPAMASQGERQRREKGWVGFVLLPAEQNTGGEGNMAKRPAGDYPGIGRDWQKGEDQCGGQWKIRWILLLGIMGKNWWGKVNRREKDIIFMWIKGAKKNIWLYVKKMKAITAPTGDPFGQWWWWDWINGRREEYGGKFLSQMVNGLSFPSPKIFICSIFHFPFNNSLPEIECLSTFQYLFFGHSSKRNQPIQEGDMQFESLKCSIKRGLLISWKLKKFL